MMTGLKVMTILGTRPEIIKLSPIIPLLEQNFTHVLVHTGQHYDYEMDKVFFEELKLKEPDYKLNIGSHSPGKQTGLMLQKIEDALLKDKPDLVIVQGDTNSTLAGAIAAAKLGIKVLHVESGCRSFNREMPEEINRILTDAISSYLIAPDKQAVNNLKKENVKGKIFLIGSTAFDAAFRAKKLVDASSVTPQSKDTPEKYVLLTLHRAENTTPERLASILRVLNSIGKNIPIVFPIHPRTLKVVEYNDIDVGNLKIIKPASYLKFMSLLAHSRFCVTDSGGIQEEALVFNVPCLIIRNETEWTRLVDAGKNLLLGTEAENIKNGIIELWADDNKLKKIKDIKVDYPHNVSEEIIKIMTNEPRNS